MVEEDCTGNEVRCTPFCPVCLRVGDSQCPLAIGSCVAGRPTALCTRTRSQSHSAITRARCKSRRFSSRRWCTAHGKSQEKKEQVPLYTSVHIVHVHLNANTTTAETSTSSALQKQPTYAAVQPHANDHPTSRMYQDMTFIPYSHAHAPLLGSAPPTRTRRSTPPPPPVVRSPHVRAHASDCAHRPPPPTPTARPRVAQRAAAYSSAGAS